MDNKNSLLGSHTAYAVLLGVGSLLSTVIAQKFGIQVSGVEIAGLVAMIVVYIVTRQWKTTKMQELALDAKEVIGNLDSNQLAQMVAPLVAAELAKLEQGVFASKKVDEKK